MLRTNAYLATFRAFNARFRTNTPNGARGVSRIQISADLPVAPIPASKTADDDADVTKPKTHRRRGWPKQPRVHSSSVEAAKVIPKSICQDVSNASREESEHDVLCGQAPLGPAWDGALPTTWVVFSDLHMSRKTCEVCLQVLETVHQEAVARNAGVLFLGDFWHVRGNLPVEPLNRVIAALSQWTQPMLMLPGNHDQVDLGGAMHSLQPLEAVNPRFHVFSEPTLFAQAVWVPYRRDHQDVRAAIAHTLQRSSELSPLKAVFAHVDVVGAHVNETFQSYQGLDAACFPADIATYSGHYHRPHTVEGTNITYVGSPYQVGWGEAGQVKQLLVLGEQWEVLEKVPLALGARHFLATTSCAEEASALSQQLQGLRPGDKVRWTMEVADNPEAVQADAGKQAHMNALRLEGVHVETIIKTIALAPRISLPSNAGPVRVFQAYAQAVEMESNVVDAAQQMLTSALESSSANRSPGPSCHVAFASVELEGFGSFLDAVQYQLAARGMVVVTGSNSDTNACESNGAGKTSLAMAPMWALTGRTDPRTEHGAGNRSLAAGEVVHDRATTARVRVHGFVDGEVFWVERAVTRRGLKHLRFHRNGQDLTTQESKLTQMEIDAALSTHLLCRAVFHGQHSVVSLLFAGDKDFKEEMAKVMDMGVWVRSKEAAAMELRAAQKDVDAREASVAARQEFVQRLQTQAAAVEAKCVAWGDKHACELTQLQSTLDEAACRAVETSWACIRHASQLRTYMEVVGAEMRSLAELDVCKHDDNGLLSQEDDDWADTSARLKKSVVATQQAVQEEADRVRSLEELLTDARLAEAGSTRVLLEAKNRLEGYCQIGSGGALCTHCLQPIDAEHFQHHVSVLEAEHDRAAEAHCRAEIDVQAAAHAYTERLTCYKSMRQAQDLEVNAAREADAHAHLKQQAQELAQQQRTFNAELRKQMLGRALDQADTVSKQAFHVGESVLEQGEDMLKKLGHPILKNTLNGFHALENKNSVLEDINNCIKVLQEDVSNTETASSMMMKAEFDWRAARREENPHVREQTSLQAIISQEKSGLEQELVMHSDAEKRVKILSQVDVAFSRSGIQSFVFEEGLAEIQKRAASHLEVLASGSLTLELTAAREAKTRSGIVERIDKLVRVCGAEGEWHVRTVRQLSGGEQRRVALALTLAFSEFALERSGMSCDLLVLDEVLSLLDAEGCTRAAGLLRAQPNKRTVILVEQANTLLTQLSDCVDVVHKAGGAASVSMANPNRKKTGQLPKHKIPI